MPLLDRVIRLFKADMNAVLDRIEDPELLLRQSIYEMEECIAADRQRLIQIEGEQSAVQATSDANASTLKKLDDELTLCFDAGNQNLARALIKRKLALKRHNESANRQSEKLSQTAGALRDKLARDSLQLEAIRQKAEALNCGIQITDDAHWYASATAISDEDVEVEWLRETQRRESA